MLLARLAVLGRVVREVRAEHDAVAHRHRPEPERRPQVAVGHGGASLGGHRGRGPGASEVTTQARIRAGFARFGCLERDLEVEARRGDLRARPRGSSAAPPHRRSCGGRGRSPRSSASSGRRWPQSTTVAAGDHRPHARPAVLDLHLAGADLPQERAPLDAHAGLLEPGVGRGQVAGARQLVAGDGVGRHERGAGRRAPRPPRRRSARRSGPRRRPAGSSVVSRGGGVEHVEHGRAPARRCTRLRRPGSRWRAPRRRRGRSAARWSAPTSRPVSMATPRRRHSSASQATRRTAGAALRRHARRACRTVRPARTSWPRMAATRAHSRPAGPPPTTSTDLGCGGGGVPVGVAGLVPGRRLADAASRSGCGRRAPGTPGCIGCTAAAGPSAASASLRGEVGVGELGPGHLDGVGDAVPTAHSAWPASTIEPCSTTATSCRHRGADRRGSARC